MSDKILSGAALAAAGVAAAGLLSARPAQAASTPTTHVTFYFNTPPAGASATDPNVIQIPNTSTKFTMASTDVQIVNFALAVETIEAERYRQVIARLTAGDTDQFGNHINGLGLVPNTTDNLDIQLLLGFYTTEGQQRDILATTLYGSPANNPFLDTTKYLFDFGVNAMDRPTAVESVYIAETIGLGAYLGGSGLLQIKSPFLSPAASFLGVEARHAAALAFALNALDGKNIQTAPLATDISPLAPRFYGVDLPLTADQVLNAGGQVAVGLIPDKGGVTPAISGPNGFVYRPNITATPG